MTTAIMNELEIRESERYRVYARQLDAIRQLVQRGSPVSEQRRPLCEDEVRLAVMLANQVLEENEFERLEENTESGDLQQDLVAWLMRMPAANQDRQVV